MRRPFTLSTVISTVALFSLTALLASSCMDSHKPDGSVLVPWRVGGQTCESAGIAWVDVELYEAPSSDDNGPMTNDLLYDVTRAQCSAGKVSFSGVRPGRYAVRVLGYPAYKLDGSSQPTRADSTYEAVTDVPLRVSSEQQSQPNGALVLAARKGAIYLNWRFSNGMMCLYNGVTTTEVTIYDSFSNVVYQKRYSCDLSDYVEALPPEEQGSRFRGVFIDELDVEKLVVEVLGYGEELANAVWSGTQEFQLSHGETRDLFVTLDSCPQGCN